MCVKLFLVHTFARKLLCDVCTMRTCANRDGKGKAEQTYKAATFKVRKAAKIRYRYNQVPHLTQDTTW